MIFDEGQLVSGNLVPKYPYFKMTADLDTSIGGYASENKQAENYFWGHQLSTIINGLTYYTQLEGKLPLVFSLKAEKI